MVIKQFIYKIALISLVLSSFTLTTEAQKAVREPKQEKLLNGLKVLMFPDQTAGMVELRLRVHSGSAFDPQGKEGVMKVLSEMIFPSDVARDYFKEDLGGKLEIVSNYDHVQLTASSKPDQFLKLLETIANAVANPTIDKGTTDVVRAAVLKDVQASLKQAEFAADQAVAERLFGIFPYGRPQSGSPESLTKIDFADIRFAYDRFFGADNATVTISGNFEPNNAYRAVRRYFGAWLKSDRRVPSTFRQPDAPPAAVMNAVSPEEGRSEIRFAFRGLARNDVAAPAAEVLARVYEAKLRAKAPVDKRQSVFVNHHSHILPGSFVFSIKDVRSHSAPADGSKFEAADMMMQVLAEKISADEFAAAKNAVLAKYNTADIAELWLDADTFRLSSVKADQAAFAGVTLADVQSLADKLKVSPVATVLALPAKKTEASQ